MKHYKNIKFSIRNLELARGSGYRDWLDARGRRRLRSRNVAREFPAEDAATDVPWLQAEHYENVIGVLAMIVVLSLILERALALTFEWSGWRDWLSKKKIKTLLAFLAAYSMCMTMDFDVLAVLFAKPNGYVGDVSFETFATAAVIAGGSKGGDSALSGRTGFRTGRGKGACRGQGRTTRQRERENRSKRLSTRYFEMGQYFGATEAGKWLKQASSCKFWSMT